MVRTYLNCNPKRWRENACTNCVWCSKLLLWVLNFVTPDLVVHNLFADKDFVLSWDIILRQKPSEQFHVWKFRRRKTKTSTRGRNDLTLCYGCMLHSFILFSFCSFLFFFFFLTQKLRSRCCFFDWKNTLWEYFFIFFFSLSFLRETLFLSWHVFCNSWLPSEF